MVATGPLAGVPGSFVQDWYNEIGAYNFARDGFSAEIGHFTQVVWKGTTEVRCGIAACSGNDVLVCNYSPVGNIEGAFADNVPPAQ